MESVEVIDINGKTYIVADEIIIDGIKYVYLNNENDLLDFMIWKVQIENEEEYIVKLDSEAEFNKALQVFSEKHQDTLHEI